MEKLFKKQEKLLKLLSPNFILFATEIRKLHMTNDYLTCISSEVEEARMDLPWKHWKTYENFEFDREHFLEETIDILKFLMNIWITLGFRYIDVKRMFNKKTKENVRRWKDDSPQLRKQVGKKLLRPNH